MNIHIFSWNSINWKHCFIHYVKSRYQIWHYNFSAPTLWRDVANMACFLGAHTFFITTTTVFKLWLSPLFLKIYSLILFYISDFTPLPVYPLRIPYPILSTPCLQRMSSPLFCILPDLPSPWRFKFLEG